MTTYLIVANQTLGSPTLAATVAERLARGAARFHVVVPATPVPHGLTWDETEARSAAEERLAEVLKRLHDLGADATGEVGNSDPVAAIRDALRRGHVDEVILSTLPAGISRWLGLDIPSQLRKSTDVPVTVVTAPREPAAMSAAPNAQP
jgi:nucleotide-binding universal stress UspA family protein